MRRDSVATGTPRWRPAALKFFARATSTNSVMSCRAERSLMALRGSGVRGYFIPSMERSIPALLVLSKAGKDDHSVTPSQSFKEILMKAIRLDAFGAAEQLELQDVPMPVPGARD